MLLRIKLFLLLILFSHVTFAGQWIGGVPTEIRKSNWSHINLIYIGIKDGVSVKNSECTSSSGLVFEDENPSSQAALTLALTAQASGKKFICYLSDRCSQIDGALATFPVCDAYPTIKD